MKLRPRQLSGVLACLAAFACGEAAPSAPPKEKELLERAIRALWLNGAEKPLGSVVTKASGTRHGSTFSAETSFAPPDRFRFDIHMRGNTLTQAFNGTEAWGMLDGTVIEVEESDLASLRSEVELTKASFLTPLRDETLVGLSYEGRAGEGPSEAEILSVRFKSGGADRILLHLDPKTALVSLIVREAPGGERRGMVLSDFRVQSGRMVPFAAEVKIGEAIVGRQTLSEICFDAPVAFEHFERPRDLNRDGIMEKPIEAEDVAFAEHDGDLDDVKKTQDDLLEWMKKSGLSPAGVPIHIVAREIEGTETRSRKTVLVCVPVCASAAPALPQPEEGRGVRRLEGGRVLSTVHVGRRDEMEAAYRRLTDYALKQGYKLLGTAREVYFGVGSEGKVIAQVQVAVEKRG
jgi:effector-binding domain-containing protein